MPITHIAFDLPAWLPEVVDFARPLPDPESRMRLAIAVARENVVRGTGGPFGAVVVERDTGKVVAAGMNLVVASNNACLHAEMVAFMCAQAAVGSWTLGAPHLPAHELYTSCDPCAMCLGATLWSGVRGITCGATREDATRLQFEEGPVFPASYAYLERRGLTIRRELLRDEANAVLELYRQRSGVVYNA